LWITGTILFGGALATMASPERWRRACLAVAGIGMVSTVAVYALLPSAPSAPLGLGLRIASPAPGRIVTSPVLVTVCGGTTRPPGPGQLLSVSVDGRQVAEVRGNTVAVPVTSGHHTLRVELVTGQHMEYAPPVLTDETISVSGIAPPPSAPGC
jgi:hypothetical protein